MGRASRGKAEIRAGRRTAKTKERRFRPASPGDATSITQLLELAEWEDPDTPKLVGAVVAQGIVPPATSYLVADGDGGTIAGVVIAGPPHGWIQALAAFGPQAQAHMARRVVDLESLVVAPEARGKGLGRALAAHTMEVYGRRGYRLMSGSFYARQAHLKPYYEQMGFTVLPPGQPLLLWIPDEEGVASYPAEITMQQMWYPLSPLVSLVQAEDPDGVRIAIDNVL